MRFLKFFLYFFVILMVSTSLVFAQEQKPADQQPAVEKKAEAPAPPAIKTNDAKSEVKEKPKVENTKLKWKLNRMFSKKTRVRRHNNAKCPSF